MRLFQKDLTDFWFLAIGWTKGGAQVLKFLIGGGLIIGLLSLSSLLIESQRTHLSNSS